MKNNKSIKRALNEYAKSVKGELIDNSHFYDFRQNIFPEDMNERFKKMFLAGDGNELISKACAVNSSSMLGFNFFHWISKNATITINSITYDEVLFEVKIPVLKGTKPANMDIVLKNNSNDYLFIESKFLEYTKTTSFEISKTYKQKLDRYYCLGEKWAEFISNYDSHKKKQYWAGIKQEICHLIGLTNWLSRETSIGNNKRYSNSGNIQFINLVFEPKESFTSEHKKFSSYKQLYEELYKQLKSNNLIPDKLQINFKTYSDLWPYIISSNLPNGLKDYLYEHYMKFAEVE
ncbi:MAG: hypothetical protein J6Y40_00735 [Bacteroidales bacterium]|nr:hypothetical protein [Bacteroidales bacterium]